MELFISVRQKSKTQSDNKINLDKVCVHDNYLGNLIVFFFDCQRESVYCFAFVKDYHHGKCIGLPQTTLEQLVHEDNF